MVAHGVVTNAMQRRPSYGPTSPLLGAKGAETRRRIVERALEVFAERGYHATVVEDLAEAVGLSRAALYQYFSGKEEIFVELVEASGAEILHVNRSIRPLGPDAEGYANLRGWLDDWTRAFRHFQPAFVQWADADAAAAPLRQRMRTFVSRNTGQIARVLAEAHAAIDPRAGALVINAVIERYHYIGAVHDVGLSEVELADGLAIALQRTLFPVTPPDVIGGGPTPADPAPGRLRAIDPIPDRFAQLSPQARATAEGILDTASVVFADVGDERASVDLIAKSADRSRGTVYKYFDGCDDLFGELARRCGREMATACAVLSDLDPTDGDALRSWLAGFLRLHARYGGVLRSWTRNDADDPRVSASRDLVLRHALHGFTQLRCRSPGSSRPARQPAGLLFVSCLERSPEAARSARRLRPAALIEAQARFIERGLLGL